MSSVSNWLVHLIISCIITWLSLIRESETYSSSVQTRCLLLQYRSQRAIENTRWRYRGWLHNACRSAPPFYTNPVRLSVCVCRLFPQEENAVETTFIIGEEIRNNLELKRKLLYIKNLFIVKLLMRTIPELRGLYCSIIA